MQALSVTPPHFTAQISDPYVATVRPNGAFTSEVGIESGLEVLLDNDITISFTEVPKGV